MKIIRFQNLQRVSSNTSFTSLLNYVMKIDIKKYQFSRPDFILKQSHKVKGNTMESKDNFYSELLMFYLGRDLEKISTQEIL